jgi:acyl carrier protein
MTESDILKDLRALLDQYVERQGLLEHLSLETRLREDLDVSSLHQVEILLAIEEHFAITVPDSETKDLETVGAWVALITRILDAKAKAEETTVGAP